MKLTVRLLTVSDLDVAGRIAMAAYKRESTLEAMLQRYLELQPDGWFLALLNGVPVGLGGAIDYGPFAYLGMMSVLPSAQNRGVGMALMETILAWLDERGCPTMLLNARSRAASLYARCGFVEIEQTLQLRLTQPPPLTQRSITGISLLQNAELDALAAFDAPAFGASRTLVLKNYFAENPSRFLLSRNGSGELTGFLLAGQTTFGPWHATNSADAEQLLQQALSPGSSKPITVFPPARNTAALNLLTRYDFKLQDTLSHMRRGQPLARDPEDRLYGMTTLMLG